MSWYKEGSINIEHKSKIVTGVNTRWANPLIGICAGQMLILQVSNAIEIYEIASIQSDTQLTLAKEYCGANKVGVKYEIPTSPKVSIEALALRISEMLNYYQIQLDAWQTILTGDDEVTLTAPDGKQVTIKSQYAISNELIKLLEQSKSYAEQTAKNADLAKSASSSATNSATAAKNSADSASSSATNAKNSAQQSADNAIATKSSADAAKASEQSAKKSADDAKKAASSIDTTKFVNLFGDLSNKSLNTLHAASDGIYFQCRNVLATRENGYPANESGTLAVMKNYADGDGCCQIYITYRNARQFVRNYRASTKSWEPWIEQITTANASADIVGAIPAAKINLNNTTIYRVDSHVIFTDTIGDWRLMPFRRNELPFGWYFRNGDNYLLSSPQGQALNNLSVNYKSDHKITIKTINGQQYINVPTAFAPDGRGFFERPVNGTTRQVGSWEDDAIRNIVGTYGNVVASYRGGSGAMYTYSSVAGVYRDGGAIGYHTTIAIDASRAVPTSNENRPIYMGFTPAIYLGV